MEKLCLDALFAADRVRENADVAHLTSELLLNRLSSAALQVQTSQIFPVRERLPAFAIGEKMEQYLEKIGTELLKNALKVHNNNQTRAAREMGISRSGLIKKLKRNAH